MSELKQKYPKYFEFFEGDEFAATTCLNKYALKDKEGNILETDPQQIIDRVVRGLSDAMPEQEKRPSNEWLVRVYKNEYQEKLDIDSYYSWHSIFTRAIDRFHGVCPQGSVITAVGNFEFPQSMSNCFVIDGPEDNITDIFRASLEEANIMRRRGGVGIDLSKLRPANSPVKNAARSSSGVYGWMDYFSNVCRSIGQNGRRGALMLTLDIKHPDAELFALAKQNLTYCTGANISLKLSDEFMEAVTKDKIFRQQFPIDSKEPLVVKDVRARDLWNTICECATKTAEPGLLFWDSCLRNLPAQSYEFFKTLSTNPCSEIPLSKDSCRLVTICATQYVDNPFTNKATFNFSKFERDIRIAMRMIDALVTAEVQALDRIIEKIKADGNDDQHRADITMWEKFKEAGLRGRRCGLGLHGVGDCLAQLCIKYDSNKALQQADYIYKCLRDCSYDESAEMAKDYGAFPDFDWQKEKSNEFIKRLPDDVKAKIKKYGRRNISINTSAPAGTISLMSRVSSGIEATFRFMSVRRRRINPSDLETSVDFTDELGDKWSNHVLLDNNVVRYFKSRGQPVPNVKTEEELCKLLPDYFITSDKIDWKKRIELQSVAQSYIDHAISSTINLPANTPVDTVKELYELAWKKGLKGQTIYVEGSRQGVLLSQETFNKDHKQDVVVRNEAPKRPVKLPCEVHFTTVRGQVYVVIVGLFKGAVYEVFCGKYGNQIPQRQFGGFVEKKGKTYLLTYIDEVEIKQVDINEYFDNVDYAAATRLISTSLRHGTPIERVIEQLQKSSASILDFGSGMARILKKYAKIEDLHKIYKKCESCGSTNTQIKSEDGCFSIICNDCSYVNSKCN